MISFLSKNKIKNKNHLLNSILVVGNCYKIKKINGIIIRTQHLNIDGLISYEKNYIFELLQQHNISWENYPNKINVVGPEFNLKVDNNYLIYDFDKKCLLPIKDVILEDLGKCVFYSLNTKEELCSDEDIFKINNLYKKVAERNDLVPKSHIYENFIAIIADEDFEIYQDTDNVFYYTLGTSKYSLATLYSYKPRYVSCVLNSQEVIPKYRDSKECIEIIKDYIGDKPTVKSLNHLKKIGYTETYLKFYFKTWINFILELNIPEESFIQSKYKKWSYHSVYER